jgi:hypothetical protein
MTKIVRNISFVFAAAFTMSLALPQAHAGVLLEPYLGYHTGKITQSGSSSETVSGPTFGGRAGYGMMGLHAGLDYMTGKWSESSTPKVDITPSALGIFVSYSFPVMLRAYGTYNFQAKGDATSGSVTSKLEGNGFKLGVQLTTFPIVAVGLEYMSTTFTKFNGNTLSNNMTNNMYGIVVSAPFDL